jgi:hypothetical protein
MVSSELQEHLDDCAGRWNAELGLLGQVWNGPGYHTRVPNGSWAHPVRESLDYALGLLAAGDEAALARAAQIVRAVLTLQDTEPTSHTYGIWPWLHEEPLAAMAPPDWNWADFCGARLAQMLVLHRAALPPDLVLNMEAALGHAAWSIFRRNVGPGYTNIAIMGAGVALVAGELLGEGRLLHYGRRRLHGFVAYTAEQGGFNEYNSPTYTTIVLHECERILALSRDAEGRDAAEQIRRAAWETLAEHFHPPTGQWAGPHSRTYGDLLDAGTAAYLAAQTGAPIAPHPAAAERSRTGPTHVPALPCPADLAPRFAALPAPAHELRRRFIRHADERRSLWGATWMDEAACLGSASADSLWTQRRPLIGYWRGADGAAAVLRLRFLRDGQDFASAGVRCAQSGPRVLAALALLENRGDYHLHLDRPADGLFHAERFALRLELAGAGALAGTLTPALFSLGAGERRALVHPLGGEFGPFRVAWRTGEERGRAYLEGVCYEGPRRAFDLAALGPVALGFGLELLACDEAPAPSPTLEAIEPGLLRLRWPAAGLELQAPALPAAIP